MKVPVIYSSVILLMCTLCGIQSSLGASILDNTAPNSDLLIRQRRDEEPQYPDDVYDSGEQDRWPTFDLKRRLSAKRGQILAGLEEANKEHIMRRQSLENSLYDLLSSKPKLVPERRSADSLKDAYVADLLKRHRLPRNLEETTMEPNKDQPTPEQHVQNKSSDDLSE